MSIGDKPINAIFTENGYCREASILTKGLASGLTYREWLIGMALSNPSLIVQFKGNDDNLYADTEQTKLNIGWIVDAIIKQLDKESE